MCGQFCFYTFLPWQRHVIFNKISCRFQAKKNIKQFNSTFVVWRPDQDTYIIEGKEIRKIHAN